MTLSKQLLILNRHFFAFLKKELDKTEQSISLPDSMFLSFLYHHDGCRQDDFTKEFSWDKAHVTRQLQSMEQKGWLTREADPSDKRAKIIRLTAEGWQFEPLLRSIHEHWHSHVFGDETEELQQLAAVFERSLQRARQLTTCPVPVEE